MRGLLPAPVRVPDPVRTGRGEYPAQSAVPAQPGPAPLAQSGSPQAEAALTAGGRDFTGPGPLDRLYQASDGWVQARRRAQSAPALTDAGLAPPPARSSRDEALAAAIAALLAGQRRRGDRPRPRGRHSAVRARQARELTADAPLIHHDLLTVIDRDDRGVTWVGPGRWLEMPGLTARPPRDAPQAGEHTEAIRRDGPGGSPLAAVPAAAAGRGRRAIDPPPSGLGQPTPVVRVRFVHVLQGGVQVPAGGNGIRLGRMAEPASATASAEGVGRADSGVIPEPTVIVRMKENATPERPDLGCSCSRCQPWVT